MTEHDNTFNAACFPTMDFGIMAGPMTLADGSKGRAVLTKDGAGTGLHTLDVHRIRKNGKLGAKLFAGVVRKSRGTKGPTAIGYIASKHQRIEIVLWHVDNGVQRFYQIKPDAFRSEEQPAFDL